MSINEKMLRELKAAEEMKKQSKGVQVFALIGNLFVLTAFGVAFYGIYLMLDTLL